MSSDRRRIPKSEEQVWSSVVQKVNTLEVAHVTATNKITQTNELLDALPLGQSMDLDASGQDGYKNIYRKLYNSLNEVKTQAEDELKAVKEALEHVSILIALKRSPDNVMPLEKRAKRSGVATPNYAGRTPGATPPPQAITLSVPPVRSAAQQSAGFSREPKARREALADQLPLKPGRKVAFRPVSKKGAIGSDGKKDEGGEEWIMAVVRKCINQDKNRYEVQDVDLTEDGQPGPSYNTTLRNLIPLPDPNAESGTPTHPSSYETFQIGATVMAQYPDTTTFYRAEVVQGPMPAPASNGKNKTYPFYRLKFEDDDGQILTVVTHLVVAWPGDT